jgi:hypothetical protein
MRRCLTISSGVVVLLLFLVATAAADQLYHSQHLELLPVGGAPLRTGFVENIHANGPQVYAHENYVLVGALANTSYQMSLFIFPTSLTCSGPNVIVPTATFQSNDAGNAEAHAVFTTDQVTQTGLRGTTVSAFWEVTVAGISANAGTVVYRTACTQISLD